MIFCGDVSVTHITYGYFETCNVEALFADVLEEFKRAGRVMINLECALTDSENAIKKFGPNLKGPVNTAKALKLAGVTECGLSNNHTFDFGTEGLRDTVKALDDNGILWTGIGENEADSRKNYIVEVDGKRIAVVAVCEHEYTYALADRIGVRPYDPYDTMEDIRKAKEEADYVVVMYHGAKEYCTVPSPRVRKLCQAMVKNGADLVMTQHSHCIGCHEKYLDGEIVYGMGNFHFVKYPDKVEFNRGLMLKLDIKDNFKITYIPTVSTDTGIRLANECEKEEILGAFEVVSTTLHNGEWLNLWHDFCVNNSELYENVVKNTYLASEENTHRELFAHFLDCEAHTDVWRELFKTWNHSNEKMNVSV